MNKYYAGVGSRKTPHDIQQLMKDIAEKLETIGYILRSGGAKGADTAFQLGTTINCIYRPKESTPQAEGIARQFHPVWETLSPYVKRLHGRNAFQVLGRNLNTPSSFLICWTKDGCISHAERTIRTGGTGTAISIADHYGIPVFNLALKNHRERIEKWIHK